MNIELLRQRKRATRAADLFRARRDEKNVVCLMVLGVHGDEETPVPIPNTAVKLVSGDYTAKVGN